jgi:hypothetical protein
MPMASPIIRSFNAGEFSPHMEGRTDLENYPSSARIVDNFLTKIQGPAVKRPGQVHVAETKDSTKESRLIPWIFSNEQSYQLEVGDQYIRFYRDNAIITEADVTITGITQANPAVVTTSGAHGYSNGDHVYINDVVGMTEVNSRRFTVANASGSTFELSGIDSTGYTAYSSGGVSQKVYEIATPYLEADISKLQFVQSDDVMYIAAGDDYEPKTLSRTGHTAWSLADFAFLDGPYEDINTTAVTLTPSAATGTITVTASSATFASTDVGRLIRMKVGASDWGYVKITVFTSSTQVTATVESTLTTAAATTNWRLGAWSDTTLFPDTVTFFQDRLTWIADQRIDMSESGVYNGYAPSDPDGTVADDHAITAHLKSQGQNDVTWCADNEKALLIGTAANEWVVQANTLGDAITPSNKKATSSDTFGSKAIQAIKVGKSALFVHRTGKLLGEHSFNFEADGFKSKDLNLFADHIATAGFKYTAFQGAPENRVWAVTEDGKLLSMAYLPEQNVQGWSRHTTNGLVESVSVSKSADGTRDEVWIVVKREVNGVDKRFVV